MRYDPYRQLGPPDWYNHPPLPWEPADEHDPRMAVDVSGATIAADGKPGKVAALSGKGLESYPSLDNPCSGDGWEVRIGGHDAMLIDRSSHDGHIVIGVADGVGNNKNGDIASTAVLLGAHEGGLRAQGQTGEQRVRSMLQGAWNMIGQCINAGDRLLPAGSTARGPATTLVMADITPLEDSSADISLLAEGDSSAWLYNPTTGELSKETVDNYPPPSVTTMEEYRDMMRAQQEQADRGAGQQKLSLTRYLAYFAWQDKSVEGPPCFTRRVPPGSVLLLFCDGFTDKVKPSSITSTLGELTMNGTVSAEQIQHALIQRVLEKPDHEDIEEDDCTVAVAVIGSTSSQP